MKLYAEYQVKDMFSGVMHKHDIDIFLEENYTAIELPTDDEIEQKSYFLFPLAPRVGDSSYLAHKGFIEGAKWVIEQIKKQTK